MDKSNYLYQLMMAQLTADGFARAAQELSAATMTAPDPSIPPNYLAQLVHDGLIVHREKYASEEAQRAAVISGAVAYGQVNGPTASVDDLFRTDIDYSSYSMTPAAADLHTIYVTTHKAPVRTAAFSIDGRYVATGSLDTSIKLIDVDKIKVHARSASRESHPVLWTSTDHTGAVNEVIFHPRHAHLASCGDDATIRIFDCSRSHTGGPGRRGGKRMIHCTHAVRSIDFHPTGDFLVAGTDHPCLALYDMNTFQSFVATREPASAHTGAGVSMVRYSPQGSLLASAGRDGLVRLWDASQGKMVHELRNCHAGLEVSSVAWSRSGNYLLTAGRDGVARLYDMRNLLAGGTRESVPMAVKEYALASVPHQGVMTRGPMVTKNPCTATFGHTEEMIYMGDERTNSIVVWATRSGERLNVLGGHNQHVRWVAASPVECAIFSCSLDHRARFWANQQQQSATMT